MICESQIRALILLKHSFDQSVLRADNTNIAFKTNKHVAYTINFDSKILLSYTNIVEEIFF